MRAGTTMLSRLATETATRHHGADLGWLDLTTPPVTRGRYVEHLMTTLGLEGPLEAALALTPELDRYLDPHARMKSDRIVEDLLALGVSASQIARYPQCGAIAPFDDSCEALGWMYVAERMTLMHGMLLRHLLMHLPQVGDACAYLSSYDDAQERWDRFGDALDRAAPTPADGDRVVAAAFDAFTCQQEWFETGRLAAVAALRCDERARA